MNKPTLDQLINLAVARTEFQCAFNSATWFVERKRTENYEKNRMGLENLKFQMVAPDARLIRRKVRLSKGEGMVTTYYCGKRYLVGLFGKTLVLI